MESKRCSRCHLVKPFSQFGIRSERGGALLSSCRTCQSARHKDYYERNKKRKKTVPETKWCWRCAQFLPSSSFGLSRSHHDGLNPSCKTCASDYARRISNPRSRLRDPTGRRSNLWRIYRLRMDDYHEMLEDQKHVCKMCGGPFGKTPHVDHCHKTGVVRGLLCGVCNSGLGYIEREHFVERAMSYLGGFTGGNR